jgi:hypothetical protein
MAVVESHHDWDSAESTLAYTEGYPRCRRCGAVKRSAAESSCVVDARPASKACVHFWVECAPNRASRYECSRCGVTSNEAMPLPVHDPIDRPSHYTSSPGGVECITVTEWMSFNIGNACKYLWRCGLKDGEDPLIALRKAKWYIDREIGRLERAKT